MRILRAMATLLLALGSKRVNVPVVPTSIGLESLEKDGFSRVLSPLSGRALQPDLPPAALRRHLARSRRGAARLRDPQFLVAPGGARRRLCLRLGRSPLLREEPPRDLHPPAPQLRRRLGDVEGHADRPDPVLTWTRLTSAPSPGSRSSPWWPPGRCCACARTSASPSSTRSRS